MKRPWNIVDVPVYSLATYKADKVNMNICTYVMPVSMKPKKYAIALTPDCLTYENLGSDSVCALQLLNKSQAPLVKPLGKKSGRKTNKDLYLRQKGLFTTFRGYEVLDDCSALILLKYASENHIEGDHVLLHFDVLHAKTLSEDILTFQYLIAQGIILN